MPDEKYRPIYTAIRALANLDTDHASYQNGEGYNGRDTEFGNSLAGRAWENWTPKQVRAAWRMLRTYATSQLPAFGIDYAAIPEPPDTYGVPAQVTAAPAIPRTITVTTERVTFGWGYGDPDFQSLLSDVKAISGRMYDGASKCWSVPLATSDHVTAIRAIIRKYSLPAADFEAIAGAKEAEHAAKEAATRAIIAASAAATSDFHVPGLGIEPYPFQRAGIAYLAEHKRAFCADEMGLGKTIQGLAVAQYANAFPLVVVCPALVKMNWAKEAIRALPEHITVKRWGAVDGITILNGGPREIGITLHDGRRVVVRANLITPATKIVIVNYDILDKHMDSLMSLDPVMVIADESHYVKNPKAKRTKALYTLTRNREYRILLSGTPLMNRPAELMPQLRILDRLSDVGGYSYFMNHYCAATVTRFGTDVSGAGNLQELNERLRATCYVRRLKQDVLTELPDKMRQTIALPITNRAVYQLAEDDLIAYLRGEAEQDRVFLDSIAEYDEATRVEMLSVHLNTIEAKTRRAEHLVRIEKLKMLAVRGMMPAAVEWVSDFLDSSDRKIGLFATHREIVGALGERFGAPTITGDTPLRERQAAVDTFQNDPAVRVIVGNIQAAGIGITLTAASDCAFLELGWNPAAHDQAEDRFHRIGQKAAVVATYLVAENTIHQTIANIIDSKRDVIDAATDGTEGARTESIMASLIVALIAPKNMEEDAA